MAVRTRQNTVNAHYRCINRTTLGILLGLRGVFPVVMCPYVCKCEQKETKMEALIVGIVLGCLLVSLTTLIVMGLAPAIDKLNRKYRR